MGALVHSTTRAGGVPYLGQRKLDHPAAHGRDGGLVVDGVEEVNLEEVGRKVDLEVRVICCGRVVGEWRASGRGTWAKLRVPWTTQPSPAQSPPTIDVCFGGNDSLQRDLDKHRVLGLGPLVILDQQGHLCCVLCCAVTLVVVVVVRDEREISTKCTRARRRHCTVLNHAPSNTHVVPTHTHTQQRA